MESGQVNAQSNVFQDSTDDAYPMATLQDNFSYPVDTDPTDEAGIEQSPIPSPTPTLPQATDEEMLTPTVQMGTPSPDAFETENAQIGDSAVTPQVSFTPGPSITPANTSTSTPTITGTVSPIQLETEDTGSFKLDWGSFVVGFAVPVLAGCGVVLYLLDRRPELFKRKL